MLIRLAGAEDEDKISELIAGFRVEIKALKGIIAAANTEQAREEFKEYMAANFPVFVAEDENKSLLGYLVCRVDGDVVWAESVYVGPCLRRQGVGSQLYERAENLAKSLGGATVYNWVHPNNDKIILFLAKIGYDVLNLIELRKPLDKEVLTQKFRVGRHEYKY